MTKNEGGTVLESPTGVSRRAAAQISDALRNRLIDVLKQLWRTNAPLTFTGLLMLPALAIAIAGLLIDRRMITDAPAWLKPAKFAVSIAIYVFTLAWAFTLIPGWRKTRSVVGWATAIAMVLEFAIIALQAYRGTTSHFNFSTPLNGVLFVIMGVAIVAQTFISIAVAVAFWRQKFEDPAMGWALRFGMMVTIAGALSAGFMTHPTGIQLAAAHAGHGMPIMGAHTVGAPDGGPGLSGTGWSTAHGDLRIPHFIGLHALQVLPLIAFVMKRRRLTCGTRIRLTFIAAGSYFALFVLLLIQALRGQPILRPDTLTFGLFSTWALVTAIWSWKSVDPASAAATRQGI